MEIKTEKDYLEFVKQYVFLLDLELSKVEKLFEN
jgi:hypothetical protein